MFGENGAAGCCCRLYGSEFNLQRRPHLKKDERKLRSQLSKLRFSPDAQTLALPTGKADRKTDDTATEAAARAALFIEKRREARYPTHDSAEVEFVKEGTERSSATVLDVSRSGLRLKLEFSVDRGSEVKVILQSNVVIFGQIRFCRPFEGGFEVGVLIQEMSQDSIQSNPHIEDDLLSLYVVGKGLTVPEVIKLKKHLVNCESCRIRLGEKDAVLNPVRKRTLLSKPRDAADD